MRESFVINVNYASSNKAYCAINLILITFYHHFLCHGFYSTNLSLKSRTIFMCANYFHKWDFSAFYDLYWEIGLVLQHLSVATEVSLTIQDNVIASPIVFYCRWFKIFMVCWSSLGTPCEYFTVPQIAVMEVGLQAFSILKKLCSVIRITVYL